MIDLTVYSLPAIFAPSIVTILAASEIGHHFGLRVAGQANVAILEAAMLGLLALMISFTFAMTLVRFDAARRFAERSESDRNRRSARALAAGPAWRRKSEALARLATQASTSVIGECFH